MVVCGNVNMRFMVVLNSLKVNSNVIYESESDNIEGNQTTGNLVCLSVSHLLCLGTVIFLITIRDY